MDQFKNQHSEIYKTHFTDQHFSRRLAFEQANLQVTALRCLTLYVVSLWLAQMLAGSRDAPRACA